MIGERVVIAVGVLVSLLLQVLLAPHISIGFAFPNFMTAFCLAVGAIRPDSAHPVLLFVVGLLYDVISGGPVGAMAFALTAMGSLEVSVFRRSNNDTTFMAMAVLVGGVFLVELVYGLLFLLFGYAASFPDAFVYRVLPCFIYNLVISIGLYFVLARLFGQGSTGSGVSAAMQSEIKQL